MRKTLIRHGNSYALVIDKPILELLRVTPDTPLELTTNGDALIVSPVRDEEHQRRLHEALRKVNRKFGRALRKLAE